MENRFKLLISITLVITAVFNFALGSYVFGIGGITLGLTGLAEIFGILKFSVARVIEIVWAIVFTAALLLTGQYIWGTVFLVTAIALIVMFVIIRRLENEKQG